MCVHWILSLLSILCVFVCCSLCALAFFNYFLKPHESQSHGSVAVPDVQEGVAYCAVNPEDGVGINYTVCGYRGAETDLDRIASPFIANGSSDCCLCDMCGDGVLGPGVTAILGPSPPNSNNFSVPACQVHSKTAVDISFVCLAHRETEMQSSAKQALALFWFQPHMPTAEPQDQTILFVVLPVIAGVIGCLVYTVIVVLVALFCTKLCEKSSGSHLCIEGELVVQHKRREGKVWL